MDQFFWFLYNKIYSLFRSDKLYMSESTRPLHLYEYSSLIMPTRFRKRLHLLYLLVTLNIFFFLVVYHRLILITPTPSPTPIDVTIEIENDSSEQHISSSICYIPRFDPWDQSITKTIRIKPVYRCPMYKQNLINIINNTQLFINQTVNKTSFGNSITHCVYLKVGRNPEEKFFRDWSYTLSEPILIINGLTDPILDTDFVLTRCYNNKRGYFNGAQFW